MEQEIIDKIGKRSFFSDDIRFGYKLNYIKGIKDFDDFFNVSPDQSPRNLVQIAVYPEGLLIEISSSKFKKRFGLSFSAIKQIRVLPNPADSALLSVHFYTSEGDIMFEMKSSFLDHWNEFFDFFKKQLRIEGKENNGDQYFEGFEEKGINLPVGEGRNGVSKYRYPALRTIAGVYKVFAWIIGLASAVLMFYFFSDENFGLGLLSLVAGGVLALGLAAISEAIKVFLDIEYNTRVRASK